MTVTAEQRRAANCGIDDERRLSIELAVAQHLRSRRGIESARESLRNLGISEDEIFRRRRAESNDANLATVLRLAVTVILSRGRLSDAERRTISRSFSEATWRAIVEASLDAYGVIVRAETHLDPARESTLDLEVGDY